MYATVKKPSDTTLHLTDEQRKLRHDRVIGIAVAIGLAALIALVVWLALLNGASAEPEHYDYWSMPL